MPLDDPVVREVTLVLREWGRIWKGIFVVSFLHQKIGKFFTMCVFVLGKESVQIRNGGQSDARFIGMETSIGFWDSHTRPD